MMCLFSSGIAVYKVSTASTNNATSADNISSERFNTQALVLDMTEILNISGNIFVESVLV